MRDRPVVLVVERDEAVRRLVAVGLELDGAEVLAADSVDRACSALRSLSPPHLVGVVFGRTQGDSEVLRETVSRVAPAATFVELGAALSTASVTDNGPDLSGLSRLLGLEPHETDGLAACRILAGDIAGVVEEWLELCRWDPMSPPDADPPGGPTMLSSIASALDRPQPIGWGPDPQVEAAVQAFTDRIGSVETAVAHLVCLREALRRRLVSRVPVQELAETMSRLDMIMDRSIQVSVSHSVDRLQQDAFTDPLTGLLNRRALERDLRRELGRAARYGRRVTVMAIDMDGLKTVNDTMGHAAGDEHLSLLARTMTEGLRLGDTAYRVGGDEFVILLPEVGESRADPVVERLRALSAPSFSWGAASFPVDGNDPEELLNLADQRLYTRRREAQVA